MIDGILEIRMAKLSRKHGYASIAMLHLVLVKASMGELTDAEDLIFKALPIAKRNLGSDHMGFFWGQYHLGAIWVKQRRWDGAERLFVEVTEKQKNNLQGRGRCYPH